MRTNLIKFYVPTSFPFTVETHEPSPGVSAMAAMAAMAAMGRLFADHQPWLLQRLSARLRNRADAEDLASETFLRVMTLPAAPVIETPRAYLTTVAKRLLINLWRRRELEQSYLDAIAQLPQATAPSPEDKALLLESLEAIAHALAGQSDKARRAFLMSQLDGLTYAEIGQRLGVSASMVRRYMAQCWEACWHLRADA